MATPAPIARLLDDNRFAVLAATLLTLPYWTSGIAKLTDLPGALGEARHFGLEPAMLTVAATILVQIGGSLLIILGRQAWLGAHRGQQRPQRRGSPGRHRQSRRGTFRRA